MTISTDTMNQVLESMKNIGKMLKSEEVKTPENCISTHDLQEVLVMAFRYAVDRNNSATDTCIRVIKKHHDQLNDWAKNQIIDDIVFAMSRNQKRINKTIWSELAEFLRDTLKTGKHSLGVEK